MFTVIGETKNPLFFILVSAFSCVKLYVREARPRHPQDVAPVHFLEENFHIY